MNQQGVIAITAAFTVYLSMIYINQFAAENQVYHGINDPPLYDRVHNLTPQLDKIYPDVGVALLMGYFVVRWGIPYPNVLINYLWIVSFLFVGRVILLSVTQLPPAIPDCSTKKKGDKLHFKLLKDKWIQCLDYMYSGHTLHCVLIALFTTYLSTNALEKGTIIVATLIEMVLIIGSRIHYTSDVLVATLVSILIFFAWPGIGNIKTHISAGGIYGSLLHSKMFN
jgi:hypothetical protein